MRIVLLCLAMVLAAPPAWGQQAPRTEKDLVAQLDEAMRNAERQGFGGAIVVKEKGRVIFNRGYGLANRERRTAFTTDTPAQIGSITKTFTAAAVSQLAAQGRISLDAPVKTYLKTAAEPAASLPIKQILVHQSGLMDSCGDDFSPLSKTELLSRCMAQPLAHKAGEDQYSNMGYSILAAIVEAVTGRSWENHLRRQFWSPLKMKTAGFSFSGVNQHQFAMGYLNDKPNGLISGKIAKLNGADWNLRGNGGIQASAKDVVSFFDALVHQSPVFSPKARALMLQPHAMRDTDVGEGFGLFHRFKDGKPYRMGHSGSDGVFFSYAAWYKTPDVIFYFVANNGEEGGRAALGKALGRIERYYGFVK